MLGMLRSAADGDDVLSPQPGLGDVPDLAAHVTEAGLPVEVSVQGAPVAIPASIDLSAYRIIQEALTNALKHAGPARARVNIRYGDDSLELEIVDDGEGAMQERAGVGGRGLIGMRERVGLFAGELSAGPRREGGFRVHVRLPIAEAGA
jgi:signal transduction histidine kinase